MVVCTDFSACSDTALQRAADIAAPDEIRVFLIHVCDPKKAKGPGGRELPEGDGQGWDEDSMRQLKEARRRYFGHLNDTDVQYDAHRYRRAIRSDSKCAPVDGDLQDRQGHEGEPHRPRVAWAHGDVAPPIGKRCRGDRPSRALQRVCGSRGSYSDLSLALMLSKRCLMSPPNALSSSLTSSAFSSKRRSKSSRRG